MEMIEWTTLAIGATDSMQRSRVWKLPEWNTKVKTAQEVKLCSIG